MALRRGVALLFSLVGIATLLSLAGVVLFLYIFSPRGPIVPDRAWLVVRPGGELLEVVPDDVIGQVLGREGSTVRSLVESLWKAKRDPRVAGVLLLPSALELPYWAKVQELRDAILDFRESGKAVVAFLEYGGDREYYLASAADRVLLLPTSPLTLPVSPRTRFSFAVRLTRLACIRISFRSARTKPLSISSHNASSRRHTGR